jgi:hypothetical protein
MIGMQEAFNHACATLSKDISHPYLARQALQSQLYVMNLIRDWASAFNMALVDPSRATLRFPQRCVGVGAGAGAASAAGAGSAPRRVSLIEINWPPPPRGALKRGRASHEAT